MNSNQLYREIPYNYTSFSDREIILRVLGKRAWEILEILRGERSTGLSAHMLLEVLGDVWVVMRNPYIQDDLLENEKRRYSLIQNMRERLALIRQRADGNDLTLELVKRAEDSIDEFATWFADYYALRKRAKRQFRHITRKDNILFDGLARVTHVTDATDWRVELPFVVLTPDTEEEIAKLVQTCIKLGLTVIPRGGGTGYTGGAIPLDAMSAVINTEKLETLGEVQRRSDLEGVDQEVAVVRASAGVVTRRISDLADSAGLVFAVDPTSQDASTIGGNVSMNAGGKKAVMWGTTLDNLVSWRMVTPDAEWLEVERLNHNLGKIHDQKDVAFRVTYYEQDGKTQKGESKLLKFNGQFFRKKGLGKDVTNKFLGGLPGIQKEGCDGLITSAEFILHRMPKQVRTVCMEFYGSDLQEAVPAIVEVKDYLDANKNVLLAGLEHLDERYVDAVKYTPKAARGSSPKMVLIADIVSDDDKSVAEAASHIITLTNARNGEGFVAVSPEARRQFWLDRARTAAIAAHTNAFKINEDVVIPLDKLAAYSEGIERINIQQSIQNKLDLVDASLNTLQGDNSQLNKRLRDVSDYEENEESNLILQAKIDHAKNHLNTVRSRWQNILDHFDADAKERDELLDDGARQKLRTGDTIIKLLLRRDLRISFKVEVKKPLDGIFVGQNLKPLRDAIHKIHSKIRSKRLFVALHMHAGDGNVHTNIPVNSNDYEMMQEAERIVDRVMELALSLDGVISGEHGIGLTKMNYLDSQISEDFAKYKAVVDPEGNFNRGKLMPGSGLDNAYTPSLRLVEQEALLLENDELGALNDDIKDCLRCGKCKPVCNTHIPRANLLYSPRNKILATGLVLEAFLYEEQTRRGISLRHFSEMNDVADHCTVCHKCFNPCPVNIDFGDVTVRMRSILRGRNKKKTNIVTKASMLYLNVKDPTTIKLMRLGLIQMGYKAQRLGYKFFKRLGLLKSKARPSNSTGDVPLKEYVVQFVKKPLPAHVPMRTTRAVLGLEDEKVIPIIRNPSLGEKDKGDSVFYFPGCGSERLFSQIGMATIAMLYETGATTVLPPSYICCGYPQNASGDSDKAAQISTENRVSFHRIAQVLSYLEINTVIVSCGTCLDQLLKYEFENIFPDCRLLDIHEYLLEKDVTLTNETGKKYVYHDPCHTPVKNYNPTKLTSDLMGQNVLLTDRCCGEAGTFAVSRPDISSQLRFRKQESLREGIKEHIGTDVVTNGEVKILTNCPACQQGLSRYADDTGMDVDYIVVEMMKSLHGEKWHEAFTNKILKGGIEKVLF